MIQSVKFSSMDISLMRPPPKFGKSKNVANLWFAKKWKILEFTSVRPGPDRGFFDQKRFQLAVAAKLKNHI